MREIRVAAAQFEPRDNDPAYNLHRIEALARQAVDDGAEIVSFHECCIQGYTWVQSLTHDELVCVAERVPDGSSTQSLIGIARKLGVVLMAGLFEVDDKRRVYNSYITVGPDGFITRFHKLHPFVNPHLTPGAGYRVMDLLGCRVGFLICYDNNLVENPRMTRMLGADIIFAPHVTGCLPSLMPGRGAVDRALWDNRVNDPARLRMEFNGPKGRAWLMKWLPARAYENGVYYVFTNPIGVDDDTIKPGLSMILDPCGDITAECHRLGDDVVTATLTPDKFEQASGQRYLNARRPELYDLMVKPQPSVTAPGWSLRTTKDAPK